MGIHDRDYYRDSAGGMFDAWGRQGVTVWLIVVTCLAFFAQVLTRDMRDPVVDYYGVYSFRRILDGEVWRLLTAVFLHAGLLHLAFNMLVLYWAGSRLAEHYGGREFLAFYLTAGVFANLVFFLGHLATQPREALSLGASGAVTAVLVVYAFHYPRQQVLVMFVIPMPVWLMVVIYVALDVLGAFGAGVRQQPIAYVVHLGGALFGFLYYQFGWRLTALFPGRTARARPRAAPRLRVVHPELDEAEDGREPVPAGVETPARAAEAGDEPFEAKVDRVLEKVSKYGQESLTPEEREILFRASEVYKKRRK